MIIDARTIPGNSRLQATICVVGAGPTGIAIANILGDSGLDVLLVEAGTFKPAKDNEDLSKGEVVAGSRHAPLHLYRRRVIGGASFVWGGRCTPFDPIDFRERAWIPHSGWPLTHADLLPWFERANHFLDAGAFSYSAESAGLDRIPFIEGFSSRELLTDRIERFSCPTNIGHKFKAKFARSDVIRLVHSAVCTRIRLEVNGTYTKELELHATSRSRLIVEAKAFVLAMGTLESIRILLASRDVMREGVGNQGNWLGRSYLSHLESTIGELRLRPDNRHVIWNYERSNDGVYVRRRFAVSETAQESHALGNAIARLTHPSIVDPAHGSGVLSAAYFTKFLLVPEYRGRISWVDKRTNERLAALGQPAVLRRHVSNLLKDLPRVAAFGPWWLWARILQRRQVPSLVLPNTQGLYPLDINIEQSPNPASRVLLSEELDRFGVPKLKVDWRMNEVDRRSIDGTLKVIRDAIAKSGCGEFTFDQESASDQFTPVGGHQMSGARMSLTAADGVVDPTCRVHGVENLFLAGSQVFPTVGYANPTLTAVALAMRLAAHIQGQYKGHT